MHPIYEQIGHSRIVPVVAMDSVEAALPLADALIANGLPLAEVTFRTAAAPEIIKTLSRERPELLVGAGTVLTPRQAEQAKECGAAFAVAPGLNPEVVKAAQMVDLPFAPGVMTPSDVERALSLGVKVLKFFPAEAAGGEKMLKSLAAPYTHLDVRFIPTGGIHTGNLNEYLELPVVLAVGGTWIATRKALADGKWEEIALNCREAARLVMPS